MISASVRESTYPFFFPISFHAIILKNMGHINADKRAIIGIRWKYVLELLSSSILLDGTYDIIIILLYCGMLSAVLPYTVRGVPCTLKCVFPGKSFPPSIFAWTISKNIQMKKHKNAGVFHTLCRHNGLSLSWLQCLFEWIRIFFFLMGLYNLTLK